MLLQGHCTVVKELLSDAGKRSCVKNLTKHGSTALHLAVAAGHADAARLLMNAGAKADTRDRVC